MKIRKFSKGIISSSLGSFWWGFLGTFYFQYITFIGTFEVVVHRSIWTFVILLITTTFFKKWKPLGKKFINRYPLFDKIKWELKLLDSGYLDSTDYSDIIALHFFNFFPPWNENNLRFYPIWKKYKDYE